MSIYTKKTGNILYVIDKDNKIVTAKMKKDLLIADIVADCTKIGLACDESSFVIGNPVDSYIIATARCADEDEFNEEIGIEIAKARLLKKFYREKMKQMDEIAGMLDEMLTKCEDYINYSWLRVDHFSKELHTILESTEV